MGDGVVTDAVTGPAVRVGPLAAVPTRLGVRTRDQLQTDRGYLADPLGHDPLPPFTSAYRVYVTPPTGGRHNTR